MSTQYRLKPAVLSACLLVCGCQQALRHQDRPHSQGESRAFRSGMDARAPALGTVAYAPAAAASAGPLALTQALLEQGQSGFAIFCSPCHGLSGAGDGLVVQHGYPPPPPLTQQRLRQAADSYLYGVISQGAGGAMPAYAQQIAEGERWAIVAYVRALQLSQGGETPPPAAEGTP